MAEYLLPRARLLKIMILGLLGSFILSGVLSSIPVHVISSRYGKNNFYEDLCSLLGLWTGLLITSAYAMHAVNKSRVSATAAGLSEIPSGIGKNITGNRSSISGRDISVDSGRSPLDDSKKANNFFLRLTSFYGYRLRPIDIPLGIILGVVCQLYLTRIFTWPLSFFVHNLSKKISVPANNLLHNLSHAEVIVMGLLVCLGSPLVEELFFRGLAQLSFADAFVGTGKFVRAFFTIVLTAGLFGLAHFEPLEFTALFGFGIVLGTAAWLTKRLGLGIVSHISFNTLAYVVVARGHF